ncbi:hypothetical protein CPT_Ponderosa_007 [Stenotrophomonas phage Ponderosa]|uniref:Uncharacterized protein n=1 Tax=Stenotrophomonas phage Ponderosa TaxID=2591103 RepID=A0A5B9N6W8_9CAUD|nr:hypothetical protein CPT_Ponderosa_007 [Stenotrophomonas phage Ponderosa]
MICSLVSTVHCASSLLGGRSLTSSACVTAMSKPRIVWYPKRQVWCASRDALSLLYPEWKAYIGIVRDLNRANGRVVL